MTYSCTLQTLQNHMWYNVVDSDDEAVPTKWMHPFVCTAIKHELEDLPLLLSAERV